MITNIKQSYKCPECTGNMKMIAENDMYVGYQCEICGTYLRLNVREKQNVISVGEQKIIVDDETISKILNKETKNETDEI